MNKELKGSQINNKLKSISDFINIDYDRIKKRKQELLYQYGKIMSLTICNDTDKDVTIPILNKNSISDLENLKPIGSGQEKPYLSFCGLMLPFKEVGYKDIIDIIEKEKPIIGYFTIEYSMACAKSKLADGLYNTISVSGHKLSPSELHDESVLHYVYNEFQLNGENNIELNIPAKCWINVKLYPTDSYVNYKPNIWGALKLSLRLPFDILKLWLLKYKK
jgi:hypothetical protein